MNIAVVTPTMRSGERGGAEALYEGLVRALRESGHAVERVEVVIDESSFDAVLEAYLTCYDLDLRAYDQVISTKAPTYMVRHPNHVSYLLHTLRVFYDMFEHEYGAGTSAQHRQRALIHTLDKGGLHPDRVRRHFTNGSETYKRLYASDPDWRQIPFRALHHPPALAGFHEPRQGEYVFLPGRLHRWKRVDLVIRALRHLEHDIALKICGSGEDEVELRALAGGDSRIEFLGSVGDEQLLDLYAGALVVPFVPRNEDYGLITVEAFKCKKPVITCHDSGEPTCFVRDMETGLVVEPDPHAIAAGLDYLIRHRDHAAWMGANGFNAVSHITWHSLVAELVAPPDERCDQPRGVVRNGRDAATEQVEGADVDAQQVVVLDMQPIDPPLGGGRIRLLGLYHALGERLPTTYIGTYDWPGEQYRRHRLTDTLEELDVPLTEAHFAAAAEWQRRAGGKNVIDLSFDLLADHSPAFVEAARDGVAAADVAIFSHPWIYPLVKGQLDRHKHLVVYDSQNVEGYLRASLLDDGGFGTEIVKHVVAVEYELCHAADLVLACSHEDRVLFHELYGVPFAKIAIMPNGTFTRTVQPADEATRAAMKAQLGLPEGPLAIFLGSAYAPNVEAAEFICTTLAPAVPHITLVVCGGVGGAMDVAWYRPRGPNNLRVTGAVTEHEKAAYLAAADLAVNPMFSGSGTNIKMFEFMALGLPIVSSPVGVRGIMSGSEEAFLVCAVEQFAAAVSRIADDRALAARLGQAARRLAEQSYAWERISAGLGRLLQRERRKLRAPRPFFSVIIASYERHASLEATIERLRAQTDHDFEVIIVDQSLSPWSQRSAYADIDLLYIHTDVKGAVSARNTAGLYARGTVLAFTDDDCLPSPDWLANARGYFDDPAIVGVEGLIVSDKRDDPRYRAVTNEGFEGVGFMTANLFLRRETFNAIDGFDERFDHPHFREDTDLGWRASDYGELPFAHDVRVYHPPHLRGIEREQQATRATFFEKDALLMRKHPDRYRRLFLSEGHYRKSDGFYEHFLRGAEKYGVTLDDFYASYLEHGMDTVGDESTQI